MSTSVIYARVPALLKSALDQEAAKAGTTLTNTIREILEDGLEGRSNRASVEVLEEEISILREHLKEAHQQVRAAKDREKSNQSAHTALARQLHRTVGTCPECHKKVTGEELLVSGSCRTCGRGLTDLLLPAGGKGIDNNEYLFLIGAVGIVLAAAFLSSR